MTCACASIKTNLILVISILDRLEATKTDDKRQMINFHHIYKNGLSLEKFKTQHRFETCLKY